MLIRIRHLFRGAILGCLGALLGLPFSSLVVPTVTEPQPEPGGSVRSTSEGSADPALTETGQTIGSHTVTLDGKTFHYLTGGSGPAVILLHGFPQDSSEFYGVMPRLAKHFTVVAVDLRGVGGSSPSGGDYDAASMAGDIHQLSQKLKLERIYLVGHDIGGMVAYAFARLYPAEARGMMILDVPIPGIDPWEIVKHNPIVWHFGFHQTPELPEQLISGREFLYFCAFFDRFTAKKGAISDVDVKRYARSYGMTEQLKAGLGFYQAFGKDERFNEAQRTTIALPFVIAAGNKSFGPLSGEIAEGLIKQGCANVTAEIIKHSGHWVVDEQPDQVAELIERYASVS